MNYYFVYILRCNDESCYTGVTNDVDRRLIEHQDGINSNSYTQNRRPVALVFYDYFIDIDQAIAFEKEVKGWTRKKKEAIIAGEWNKLKELSVCKNGSSHKNK